PAQISVFSPSAEGDVAPTRIFTDDTSQMNAAAGIALVAQPTLDVRSPSAEFRLVVGPNPVRDVMTARVWLAQPAASLRIDVLDLQGRIVTELWDGPVSTGTLDLRWDARAAGRPVRSGIYWVQVQSARFQARQRVAIVH